MRLITILAITLWYIQGGWDIYHLYRHAGNWSRLRAISQRNHLASANGTRNLLCYDATDNADVLGEVVKLHYIEQQTRGRGGTCGKMKTQYVCSEC